MSGKAGVAAFVGLLLLTVVVALRGNPWRPDAATPSGEAVESADSDPASDTAPSKVSRSAQNVILLIGDGMGSSEITAARNYAYGAAGRMAADTMPVTGTMTVYSVIERNPRVPDYAPDSASTATAWSTGTKTADGRISTAAGTDDDLRSLLDEAGAAGMRTGVVTTSELTDATPAALLSHVADRSCQGPADMAACPQDEKPAGPGSIAEQSIDHGVDVLLGGGRRRYEQSIRGGPNAGQTVLEQAAIAGYTVVGDREGLATADRLPLLGLFTPGHLATRWTGPIASRLASRPQRCDETNRDATGQPQLSRMTHRALQLLNAPADGDAATSSGPGFFLQVESASIDR